MNTRTVSIIVSWIILWHCAPAAVDTLRDTSDIGDTHIYNYADCFSEQQGENCRRYNAGSIANLRIGNSSVSKPHRALFTIPGWNDTIPDSSEFLIYCFAESDAADRKIFLYPVTTAFFVGTELASGVGDYPDPDSGVTWNHAWLDVGDSDSLLWSNAGGDYTTAIACTTTISGTGQYFSFKSFNRILTYWDTSGSNYGFILINEDAFPANNSEKAIKATETGTGNSPLVLLYTAGEETSLRRRRTMQSLLK
ncbi:MAG: hypothetical protein ACE5FH_11750 [Candidatus Zixiibacteriota bacterium]